MSWLTALVMIIIIVVVAYFAWPMLKEAFTAMTVIFANMAAAATLGAALSVALSALISALPGMIIKMAAQSSHIVGADVNELSPIKNFDSYNFLAAKLAYKIISYSFEFRKTK